MTLIVEVTMRIMGTQRRDPSIMVEASRRHTVPWVTADVEPDQEVAGIADEIAAAAVALDELAGATRAEALEQATATTRRIREQLR